MLFIPRTAAQQTICAGNPNGFPCMFFSESMLFPRSFTAVVYHNFIGRGARETRAVAQERDPPVGDSPSNSVLYPITDSFLPPCGMCFLTVASPTAHAANGSLESALLAIHRSGIRVFQRRISLPGPRGSRALQKRVRSGRLSLYSPTGGINSRKRRYDTTFGPAAQLAI